MLKLLVTLAVCVTAAPEAVAAGPHEPGCDSVQTTLDGIACREKQINEAGTKMQKYLEQAKARAKEFSLPSEKLDREQEAWEKYRSEHCGNVYQLWAKGMIRYDMSAQCNLRSIKQRTYEIWASYLTFVDSTPPLLPEPSW